MAGAVCAVLPRVGNSWSNYVKVLCCLLHLSLIEQLILQFSCSDRINVKLKIDKWRESTIDMKTRNHLVFLLELGMNLKREKGTQN